MALTVVRARRPTPSTGRHWMTSAVRIAMWSGPRNISTALLRSWGNRPDTVVVDEPLYAHYLATTGRRPPRARRGARGPRADWRRVVADLRGPLPAGKHDQLSEAHGASPAADDRPRVAATLTHAFLIRDPREMLTSLAQVLAAPSAGGHRPAAAGGAVRCADRRRAPPPVVDARDVLERARNRCCGTVRAPRRAVRLRAHAGVARRATADRRRVGALVVRRGRRLDGLRRPYRPPPDRVPPHLQPLVEQCLPYYEHLHACAHHR